MKVQHLYQVCQQISFVLILMIFCSIRTSWSQSISVKSVQAKDVSLEISDPHTFFSRHAIALNLTSHMHFELTSTVPGANKHKHHRYRQHIQDIPVFGRQSIVHEKGGMAFSITGHMHEEVHGQVTQPELSEFQAIRLAKSYLNVSNDKEVLGGQLPVEEATLNWVDPQYPRNTNELVLAYHVRLRDDVSNLHTVMLIDAKTGRMITESPQIAHQGVPAKGLTKYYGEKEFICDSLDPGMYQLIDDSRGDGIRTLDGQLEVWTNESNYWDFTNEENEVAIDLHWGMTEFYDMMLGLFDWDGIDNQGGALVATVSDDKFINAFWNGEYATFGRGDCHHGPLTTLEVISHELMHGVTDYTSNLIYQGESGAINESMSDVFGKALEYYEDPAGFDWLIGESFILNQYGRHFRSMEDPNTREHPKYYGGLYWEDNAGVHTNSSIGNHWFYRLVEGGSGMNEAGYTFDMEGIGMEKALQIVFLTQSAYLFESSNYQHYYESSLLAAEEIYGQGSLEHQAVEEAWRIVGFPSTRTTTLDYDLTFNFQFDRPFDCLENEYASGVLMVENLGLEPYDPDIALAQVTMDQVPLAEVDEVIEPGEVWTKVIPEAKFVDWVDFEFYILRLLYSLDENEANNRSFTFLENGVKGGVELEFTPRFGQMIPNCSPETSFDFFVENLSCQDYVNDQPIDVTISNNGVQLEVQQIIIEELGAGDFIQLSLTFENTQSWDEIQVTFENVQDLNTDNQFTAFLDRVEPVIGEFEDNFEKPFFGPEWMVQNAQFVQLYNLPQSGGKVVAVSGQSTSPRAACTDAPSMIESYPESGLIMCVDASNLSNPRLTFQLSQYQNNNTDYPELEEFSSVLGVRLVNDQIEEEYYVYGRPEGVWEDHAISLPPNFDGRVEFRFACVTGSFPGSPDFLDYDVILLDNVVIDNLSSTTRYSVRPLVINPVPARNWIEIDIKGENITEVELLDMTGKKWPARIKENHQMDIADLAPGVYHIRLSAGGEVYMGRFVKQ